MSSAPPPPPPLPPPFAPSQRREHIPPPPSASAPPTARPQIFEHPTAPFPTSPSSLDAVPPVDYDPDAVDDPHTSSASEDDRSADSSPRKKSTDNHQEKPPPTHRRVRCFSGHSLREAATSRYLPTPVLLLFRLVVAAMLVGHLIYFGLTGAFSFRLYATWAYAGLVLTFLFTVTCSLLDLLRDDTNDQPTADEEEGGHSANASLPEQQDQDSGFSYFVAQVTVPLYQVFVTATLFGAIIFWAAILPAQSATIDYPLLALNAVAPAVAAIDLVMSLRMQFRLVYVPLVILFNAAYAAALFAFYKLEDIYVYVFIDPAQPKGEFVAKAVGLAAASVVAPLFLYALSLARDLFVRRRGRKNNKEPEKEKEKKRESDVDDKSVSEGDPGVESENTSDSSQVVQNDAIAPPVQMGRDHEFDVDEVVIADSDDEKTILSNRSVDRRDRSSVPISKRPSVINSGSNKRWYRSSTSARMQTSLSGESLGEVEQMSQWDELELEGVQVKAEAEYFTMPAAFNGGKEDVVKLTPVMRGDASNQFARSGSGRQLFRSGSGRHFVRSTSGRALARSSSGSSIRRSDSGRRPSAARYSGTGSRPRRMLGSGESLRLASG